MSEVYVNSEQSIQYISRTEQTREGFITGIAHKRMCSKYKGHNDNLYALLLTRRFSEVFLKLFRLKNYNDHDVGHSKFTEYYQYPRDIFQDISQFGSIHFRIFNKSA